MTRNHIFAPTEVIGVKTNGQFINHFGHSEDKIFIVHRVGNIQSVYI